MTTVEDQHGAKTTYSYNSVNQKTYECFKISEDIERVIRYAYDAAGNMIEKSEGIEERFLKPNGKQRKNWTGTQYQYDPNGNCIHMVTPKGYEKEWQYDALDRVVVEKEQDKNGGICRIFQYEYDALGNLCVRRNQSMQIPTERKFCYDSRNRVTHIMDENGNTTRLFYDSNNRLTKVVRPQQYNSEQDNGQGICYTYDSRDQVVKIAQSDGTILQERTYNNAGKVTTQSEGQFVYTKYAYDLAGNLLAVYKGRENAEHKRAAQRMGYDAWGNVTAAEDGNGNQTKFHLDDWGRITEVYTPEGGIERYTYDYAGNITSTTDANGGKITYFYNSMGQVYQVTDQEGASEYFYYDEEGRPETHIDRNGNMETTHYNMDGNLLYRRAVDKKGRNPVTYRYIYYPDGKIKQTEGGGITYDYAYTPNDLLKSKSASGKPLFEYTYDRNGNLSCLTDSIGNSLHYTYDTINRLEQVSEGQGNILASYSYHSFGGLCKLQYGNGIQTEYKYNDVGTLSSLVTVTKQGQVLLNFNYAYDENGNCIQKSGDLYQNAYAYDRMNRLIESVQDGKSEKYTYDLAGNRLKRESEQKTERYQYNAKNQLTGIQSGENTIQYRYDPQGNMLEELGCTWKKHYTYDAANRQKDIELTRMSDDKSEYFHQLNCYDGEGLRYETKENGKVIRFLFDRGELTEEIREDAHIRYARGYDLLSLTWNETEKNYFVPDEMGSTLFLLDKDHEIQKTYHYDAFGTILNESGDTLNRLTYTGQMYDGAMGQYYLRARFYNPSIGRFMQEDVYRSDGLNLYAYCANNPVMYFDPSGYIELPCILKHTSAMESYAITDSVIVSGKRAIDQGHSYEIGVRNLYGDVPFTQRQYEAKIKGKSVSGIADNVILGENIAIEAKYVNDWTKSLRNPRSSNGDRPWAIAEQNKMLEQAMKYSNAFEKVIYHTNSVDLADFYTPIFNNEGIKNFEFVITPVKK